MEVQSQSNNRRIAKNTVMLYMRMFLSMVVSLFTSRIILDSLGVDNFGIYNVVGGFVAMFSLMSGALSNSVSRFLTFELGKGEIENLKRTFSTSLNVMFLLSLVVLLVGETVGLWFLNYKVNIPVDRMGAANLVYQLSIVTFIIGLVSVPYNASIISHEKMSAFAYIGIFEIMMRLVIVYTLYVSPIDKLKTYAILLFLLSLMVRMIYGVYCHRHFEETRYKPIFDRQLLRQMTGFAGWNFLAQGACQLNNSGVNLLINIFFGVTLNAARGIASQVNNAVGQFTSNFMVALSPQITKSFANGEYEAMHKLVFRGAKFSYFMTLFFLVPICLETDYILRLWLKTVPDYSVEFVRWTLYISALNMLSSTLITGLHASGNIKRYMIIVGIVEVVNFPLTWIAFKLGASPLYSYYIYFAVYFVLAFLRLVLIKDLIKMRGARFVREVYVKVAAVTVTAPILPILIMLTMPSGFLRLVVVTAASMLSTVAAVYVLGLTREERKMIANICKERLAILNIRKLTNKATKDMNRENHMMGGGKMR